PGSAPLRTPGQRVRRHRGTRVAGRGGHARRENSPTGIDAGAGHRRPSAAVSRGAGGIGQCVSADPATRAAAVAGPPLWVLASAEPVRGEAGQAVRDLYGVEPGDARRASGTFEVATDDLLLIRPNC